MTLYIPPGYGQVLHSITLTGDAEPMAVTYGVKLAVATDTETEIAAVTNSIHSAIGTTLIPPLSTLYHLQTTELRYLFAADDPDSEHRIRVTSSVVNGASNDAPAPQNCAMLFHKRTARAGRRGRGRFYMPGPLEASVSATGAIESTYLAAAQGHANDLLTALDAIGGLDGSMWLLHSTGEIVDVPALLPDPDAVTSLTVDPIIATQRRRLRR